MNDIVDVLEALVRFTQQSLTEQLKGSDDKTLAISCAGLLKPYVQEETHAAGDVRLDPDNGKPYECRQGYDGKVQPTWTIKDRTLWIPYHSKAKEWALPWEAPTGAHDMYRAGEYMTFTDAQIYKAKRDTDRSPVEVPGAWEVVK